MFFWNNKSSLVIKQTDLDDAGRYRCEVRNPVGVVDSSADLTVHSMCLVDVCVMIIRYCGWIHNWEH